MLDTPPEQAVDDLTFLAAQICQAPTAMVSLIDGNRQWFKSKLGLDLVGTSREIAFCAHTILHRGEMLEIHDVRADPRFADNPLVVDHPHMRFYAGAPLITPDGHALGTLCVLDTKPRKLRPEQRKALYVLAHHVVSQLELRRHARELVETREDCRKQKSELARAKAEIARLRSQLVRFQNRPAKLKQARS